MGTIDFIQVFMDWVFATSLLSHRLWIALLYVKREFHGDAARVPAPLTGYQR